MKVLRKPQTTNTTNIVEECENYVIQGFCCKTIKQDPNKPTK